MRNLIKKILKESEEDEFEWVRDVVVQLPRRFVITFCKENWITKDLIGKIIKSFPEGSEIDIQFLQLIEQKNTWAEEVSWQGVVMYFIVDGNYIKWYGWDDCRKNSVSRYDDIYTIKEYLTLFGK